MLTQLSRPLLLALPVKRKRVNVNAVVENVVVTSEAAEIDVVATGVVVTSEAENAGVVENAVVAVALVVVDKRPAQRSKVKWQHYELNILRARLAIRRIKKRQSRHLGFVSFSRRLNIRTPLQYVP